LPTGRGRSRSRRSIGSAKRTGRHSPDPTATGSCNPYSNAPRPTCCTKALPPAHHLWRWRPAVIGRCGVQAFIGESCLAFSQRCGDTGCHNAVTPLTACLSGVVVLVHWWCSIVVFGPAAGLQGQLEFCTWLWCWCFLCTIICLCVCALYGSTRWQAAHFIEPGPSDKRLCVSEDSTGVRSAFVLVSAKHSGTAGNSMPCLSSWPPAISMQSSLHDGQVACGTCCIESIAPTT
jgi:hypothetical protein